jgi:hypothetical protein
VTEDKDLGCGLELGWEGQNIFQTNQILVIREVSLEHGRDHRLVPGEGLGLELNGLGFVRVFFQLIKHLLPNVLLLWGVSPPRAEHSIFDSVDLVLSSDANESSSSDMIESLSKSDLFDSLWQDVSFHRNEWVGLHL